VFFLFVIVLKELNYVNIQLQTNKKKESVHPKQCKN
jgi:hypothetical protein